MELYIIFGSLSKFQQLFDSNEFVRSILSQTVYNVYFIDADKEQLKELRRLLTSRNIKFDIK